MDQDYKVLYGLLKQTESVFWVLTVIYLFIVWDYFRGIPQSGMFGTLVPLPLHEAAMMRISDK